MTIDRKQLARQALTAALQLRTDRNRSLVDPIAVYDLAEELGIEVRFDAIASLEGMYSNKPIPAIIIGSERPVPRRVFTCAHELGHHVFKHGTRIDELRADDGSGFDPEEYLAQAFAGFLLMPKLAVCKAFTVRGWNIKCATPEQIYQISNYFGVGYTSLIHHMHCSLGILAPDMANMLMGIKIRDIRAGFVPSGTHGPLLVADKHWTSRAVDLEVGESLLLPRGVHFEGTCLKQTGTFDRGDLFEAVLSGCGRISELSDDWAVYVRVSRQGYVGRSKYRHLEEVFDNEQ